MDDPERVFKKVANPPSLTYYARIALWATACIIKAPPLGRLVRGLAAMAPRKPYPTDVTDPEWECIAHLVPAAKAGGRPEKYPKREIRNGLFYVVRSGGA